MHLVIFDLETIGFPARHHEIIQIAAVRMLHGEVLANECSLLVEENPQSAPPIGRKHSCALPACDPNWRTTV